MSDFERLGVGDEIILALEELGWLLPTAIQDEAIPLILTGGDVCATAETGSGKTGAFGLPILQLVAEDIKGEARVPVSVGGVPSLKSTDPRLTIDGMEARSGFDGWVSVRGTPAVPHAGKYQFEVEILPNTNGCRVGWGTAGVKELGRDRKSFGYGYTGKKGNNGIFEDYGARYTVGDVIGCLIDRGLATITFAKNGTVFDIAYQYAPSLDMAQLYPFISGRRFNVRVRFDNFIYPIAGYKPVGEIPCPEEAVPNIGSGPLAVILEPTRDLAQQTYNCLKEYEKCMESVKPVVGLFTGGFAETQGHVDIIVGTPSKVNSIIGTKKRPGQTVKYFVLDEADQLIRNDVRDRHIPAIREKLPQKIQCLFFSATLHSLEVKQAINTYTTSATWIDLKGKPTIPSTVHSVCYYVDPTWGSHPPCTVPPLEPPTDGVHMMDGGNAVPASVNSQLIKKLKPRIAVAIADCLDMKSCLVFCRTNLDCDNFEKYLVSLGGGKKFAGKTESGLENAYSCLVLAGMRSSQEREANLAHFKAGDVRFLICTDVAARGIDIEGLPFVIMLTLPDNPDDFFHRVGRVGRADNMGLAIMLVSPFHKEKVWFHTCKNRGHGCQNTGDVAKGGCTIWYDEPAALAAIEQAVGNKLPVMDPATFNIPGIIEVDKAKTGDKAIAKIYGKSKNTNLLSEKHVKEIESAVSRLQALDCQVQRTFVQFLVRGIRRPQI